MRRLIRDLIPPTIRRAIKRRLEISKPNTVRELISEARQAIRELEDVRAQMAIIESLDSSLGMIIESPKYIGSDDAGFNGQQNRKKIFMDLIKTIKFDALIETGTWFGNTAGFMHKAAKLPVFTCELNRCYYLVAKTRLADLPAITLDMGDSRQFLKSLAGGRLSRQVLFFYLDAHWNEDLPLKYEIEIITSKWEEFVIMIDDFKVPGDDGYGFDNYGEGKSLTLETLAAQIRTHALRVFFPSTHSSKETGAKRGCVVLARRGALSDRISRLGSLRLEEL